MRRKLTANLPVLPLAILIFWGMSGRAFSAAFCQTLRCALPVKAAAPKPVAHSCCEEKKAKPKPAQESKKSPSKGCCCKFDTFNGTVSETLNFVTPESWQIALPTVFFEFACVPPPVSVPAFFYSDSSPPIVALASVRDRAPPSA